MDIKKPQKRERESSARAIAASSDEARVEHEGLSQGDAVRWGRKQASAVPLKVKEVDGDVLLTLEGQPGVLLTSEAASATADSLQRGVHEAGQQVPRP